MKYGVSQEIYTIHYNDIRGKHKLPKYLKCDTSKKNQMPREGSRGYFNE